MGGGGATTPRKSDQGKTAAIILAQVDGKCCKRYTAIVTTALRALYCRLGQY